MIRLHPLAKIFALAGVAMGMAGCSNLKVVHIPPGQSMNEALAKKAELVRMPGPARAAAGTPGHIPAVEPPLPGNSTVERTAEAYSRGEFCLGAGKDEEAIAAFEEVVRIDPAFAEAWQQLAMLYEKKGNAKKAMEAFKRAKKLASH
jgi:tetratricopeptide (TPR) repeat protein